ncbi:MAG TPA: alpha/beta hydrolase [Mycobacteriales bacterium]|nr:alpha/beta hydrolase [Mycobacteriales bacterium]
MDPERRPVGRSVVGEGGVRLYLEDHGGPDGPAVVLLHGLGFCRLAWARQVGAAELAGFRLVTVDLRGHGGSDAPPDGYADPARWAGDLAAVLGGLGLSRPVLVGWSYGGTVICDYLRHRLAVGDGSPAAPGAVGPAGVVFVGAVSDLGTPRAVNGLTEEFVAVSRRLVRAVPGDLPAAVGDFVDLCTHRPLPAGERGRMHGWNSVLPDFVRAGMLRRTLDHDATLRALRAPTLVLHGEADRVIRPAYGRYLAGAVPGARLVTVPGAGHMPFWESPERFNAELAGFAWSVTR